MFWINITTFFTTSETLSLFCSTHNSLHVSDPKPHKTISTCLLRGNLLSKHPTNPSQSVYLSKLSPANPSQCSHHVGMAIATVVPICLMRLLGLVISVCCCTTNVIKCCTCYTCCCTTHGECWTQLLKVYLGKMPANKHTQLYPCPVVMRFSYDQSASCGKAHSPFFQAPCSCVIFTSPLILLTLLNRPRQNR